MPPAFKPQPGQRTSSLTKSASFMANVVDAVNEVRSGANKPPPKPSRSNDATVVVIKNNTGGNLKRGQVVQLKTPLLTFYDSPGDGVDTARLRDHRAPWWNADKVAEPRWLHLAVALAPIKQDERGPVAIDGFCTLRMNVNSTKHLFATTKAGQLNAESSQAGMFQLLAPLTDGDTGEREVFAKFVPLRFYGKLTDTSPKQQSGVWYPGTARAWGPVDPRITSSSGSTGTDDQPAALSEDDYSVWPWAMNDNTKFQTNDQVIVFEMASRLIAVQAANCLVPTS